jgi:hypothetical protein
MNGDAQTAMANKSDWKGFEKLVAEALGGKRRLRTMESFGKVATDVYFPKKLRKRCPFLNNIMIECKKRHNMNIHSLFAEAHEKYVTKDGHILILASKVPRTKNLKNAIQAEKEKTEKRYRKGGPIYRRLKKEKKLKRWKKKKLFALKLAEAKIRAKYSIRPLITVDLDFFKDLFHSWVEYRLHLKEDFHGY